MSKPKRIGLFNLLIVAYILPGKVCVDTYRLAGFSAYIPGWLVHAHACSADFDSSYPKKEGGPTVPRIFSAMEVE